MKKYLMQVIVLIMFVTFLFITPCFGFSENKVENLTEKKYVYETDLITKETKKIEIDNYANNNIKSLLLDEEVSMEPYIPDNLNICNLLGQISLNAIFGEDDRIKIDNTTVFPYCAIAYISINNASERGTAVMVDDNIAVTAAHCVVGKDNVQVFPGRNGNSHPYGGTWATKYIWAGSDSYKGETDYEDDWAILVLEQDIGDDTGWFGVSNMAEYNGYTGAGGKPATITGYPISLGYEQKDNLYYQYTDTGMIIEAQDKFLRVYVDATKR